MFLYPGSATPFGPFPADFARTRAPRATPATADPLSTCRPAEARVVTDSPTQADDIERTLVQARAVGVEQGWSLDACMSLSSPLARPGGRTAAELAETRYAYVKTLAGRTERPDAWAVPRHPWRACESTTTTATTATIGATGKTGTTGTTGKTSSNDAASPFADAAGADDAPVAQTGRRTARAWLDDGTRARFAVAVRPLSKHCLMRVAVPGGAPPGPLLRRADFLWGPLAQETAVVPCSPLRRYAVVPRAPEMEQVIYAGGRAWRGAADAWCPVPAGAAAGVALAHCAYGPIRFAELLALLDEAAPLYLAADRAYLPIRDGEGRFWLPVAPADARVAQVADPRTERCLPALFVQPAQPDDAPWRQAGADLPEFHCAVRAVPHVGVRLADDASTAPGSLMGQGFDAIATELGGSDRCDPRHAGALAERMLLDALGKAAHPPTARAALAPMLDAWPESLRDRASDVIRYVLKDIWRVAVDFNRADGRTLHLVDNLAGGGDFVVWRGEAFVTPAIAELSPQALAHRLVDGFVAGSGGRAERFARLPERNATLTRAGRFSAYDPTLMQEMLGWPEAARSLAALATFYPGTPDTTRVRALIATPRRADLLSQDRTDNLALALTDRGTVMAIIDALYAAQLRKTRPEVDRVVQAGRR